MGATLCVVETVDNGVIVRFDRVQKVQRPVTGPDPMMVARLGGELLRAVRGEGEAWKEGAAEGEAAGEPILKPVYVIGHAAIFCRDSSELVVAVDTARKERAEIVRLGFESQYAQALPAGIGLSQVGGFASH